MTKKIKAPKTMFRRAQVMAMYTSGVGYSTLTKQEIAWAKQQDRKAQGR